MERITESELYAELVAAYKRPPPIQDGDITTEQFAGDTGLSLDLARAALLEQVKAGRLVVVLRTSRHGRRIEAFRAVTA